MAGKLITIARFDDYMEASIAKQTLEAEGIAAFVVGENLTVSIGMLPAFGLVELQVNEADEEAAMEILEDFNCPPDIINPYEDGFEDENEDY